MKNNKLIYFITTGSVFFWIIILFKIPLFHNLRNWFWPFHTKELQYSWLLILLIFCLIIALFLIIKVIKKSLNKVIILIVLGYLSQFTFGFIEGRGIDAIRDRLVTSGHSEFAKIAVTNPDFCLILNNYENLASNDKIGKFPKAKPPGCLLFHVALEKIVSMFFPSNDYFSKYYYFTLSASLIFPLISYLVLIPLFFLARFFLSEYNSLMCCLLYIFIPNTLLMTLHLDQVVYPFFFVSCLYLTFLSIKKDSILYSTITGIVLFAGLFFSFSIVPICFLIVCIFISDLIIKKSLNNGRISSTIAPNIKNIMFICLSFVVLSISTYILFNYNIIERFNNALAFHHQWIGWKTTPKLVIYYSTFNFVELFVWLGASIPIVLIRSFIKSLQDLQQKKIDQSRFFIISIFITLILMALLGNTTSEVGRLWIFMVPALCLIVIIEINQIFQEKSKKYIFILLAFQLISCILIKYNMDF